MARRAVVAIACAFTAVALTSCGSREAEVLGTAFKKHINTADVTVKVDVSSKEIAFGATHYDILESPVLGPAVLPFLS